MEAVAEAEEEALSVTVFVKASMSVEVGAGSSVGLALVDSLGLAVIVLEGPGEDV